MKKPQKFPGLNALRFLAAAFVFLHHVEQHKFWMDMPNLWGNYLIDNIGHQSRIFFFVLSGFLITYLFLKEKSKTGKINWFSFQARRALRLWPVYFLMVGISFLVLPQFIDIRDFNESLSKNLNKELIIYLLLLPNLARMLPPVIGANQFWSVGVQEQFYWIWPLIMQKISRGLVPFLILFIVFKIGGEYLLIYLTKMPFEAGFMTRVEQILWMWQLLLFEQMAVGALGAYLVFHNKDKILNIVFHPATSAITFCVFILLLFQHYHFSGYTVIQGFIALIIILNISLNNRFPVQLNSPILDYLGNISFGMYAYHTAIIASVITVLSNFQLDGVWFNILLYSASFGLTIVISAISYRYFERYFLNLKDNFRSEKIPGRRKGRMSWLSAFRMASK